MGPHTNRKATIVIAVLGILQGAALGPCKDRFQSPGVVVASAIVGLLVGPFFWSAVVTFLVEQSRAPTQATLDTIIVALEYFAVYAMAFGFGAVVTNIATGFSFTPGITFFCQGIGLRVGCYRLRRRPLKDSSHKNGP